MALSVVLKPLIRINPRMRPVAESGVCTAVYRSLDGIKEGP